MPQDSTIANADLWSKYFQNQWSWLSPSGRQDDPMVQMAAGTGARVANFLTLVAAGPVAWLYANSAPKLAPLPGGGLHVVPAATSDELESVEEYAA